MPVGVEAHRTRENRKASQKPRKDEAPNQRADKTTNETLPAFLGLKKL